MVCVQAHRSSQTPPLIVLDIHRVLEGTGMLECPDHKLDHGVPDPKCDYCKRGLGLYKHSALAREIPILTFDFSGPHPSMVHPAKQLMVIVWCLQEVRLISLPPHLHAHLKSWAREELKVRVFQGVRRGGPAAHRVPTVLS